MDLPKLLQRGTPPSKPRHHHKRPCAKKTSTLLSLLTLVTLALLLAYTVHRHRHRQQQEKGLNHGSSVSVDPVEVRGGYGVIIDIGRAEARVRVIQLQETETVAVRVLGSRAGAAPFDLPALLGEFVEFAREWVAEAERATTRVYVVGTGGWEWIAAGNRADVLSECRKGVRASGFAFRDEWAVVINGRDEGVYEWLAANYARAMVQSDHTDTIGVLNLKDESAQVTFVAEKEPPFAYSHKVELWGATHNLYSYSFDKLGLATASTMLLKLLHARVDASSNKENEGSKVVLDPCTPRGFRGPNHFGSAIEESRTVKTFPTVPSGNFSQCRAELLGLLQQGQQACHEKKCPAGTVFVPELRGNFIAAGKFFETSKVFRLPAMASLSDMVAAGESYCGGEVGNVLKDPFPEYEVVRKPCFSAAFIVAFLHDSLGLPVTSSKVLFTDAVNGVAVDWTVGFFLAHLLERRIRTRAAPVFVLWGDISGGAALYFLGLVASAAGLVFLLCCCARRWRGPPLKTIYDLEKGRYITTPAAAAARGR